MTESSTVSGEAPPEGSAPQGPLRARTRHPSSTAAIAHITAVDGARGIAILSVLLYHSGWSDRGLFGVDMFFVVSGFLITLLLLREASKRGRVRIAAFYGRRAKRLLPPLIITLALTVLAVWRWGSAGELRAASETALASLLQVANWHQIGNNTAYWEATGHLVPLGQMWSLSVTEQFYIVWPVLIGLLWFLSERRPSRVAGLLFLVAIASGVVAPLLFDGTNTDRLYLGTDARAVSFVIGGAMAALVTVVVQKGPRWAHGHASRTQRAALTAISATSLAAVVSASVMTAGYHESWLYLGGFASVSLLIAVFISTLCFPGNALARFFEWRPFQTVGVLSYSMFLLHLPVFWLIQTSTGGEIHPLFLFVLGTFLTWLIATVLHHVFTEPLRLRSWKPVSATITILVSTAVVVGLALWLPNHKLPPSSTGSAAAIEGFLPVNGPAPGADFAPRVAVVGDSVAGNMAQALVDFRTTGVSAVDVSFGGCGLFDADATRALDGWKTEDVEQLCWPWQQKLQAAIADDPFDVFLVHDRFDVHDQLLDGTWVRPGDPAWNARYRRQIERLIDLGKQQETPPLILLLNDAPTAAFPADRLEVRDVINEELAADNPNVRIVDFASARCPNGSCPTKDAAGQPLYYDGTHFGDSGLALLAPWLEEQITVSLRGADPGSG